MTLFGFLLAVCYVPGFTGISIETQWPALTMGLVLVFCVLVPLGEWRRCEMTAAHWLGLAFVGYSAVSMAWAVNRHDGVWGLWLIGIWGLSFWLGSTLSTLEPLWKGLALGLGVSSAVAMAQAAGLQPVLVHEGAPGLLYSPLVSGAASALMIVALICHRQWAYIVPVAPLLLLSHNRGGWAALGLALAAKYLHWGVALAAVVIGGAVLVFHPMPSDVERIQIWRAAWENLTWFGLGPDSFASLWVRMSDGTFHQPGTAHDDYLQMAFEAGLGAIPILGLVAISLASTGSRDWPVFVAFAVLALVFFPLHSPLPAFAGCLVAGHLARDRMLAHDFQRRCRSHLVPGARTGGLFYDPARGRTVSVAP